MGGDMYHVAELSVDVNQPALPGQLFILGRAGSHEVNPRPLPGGFAGNLRVRHCLA